MGKRRTRELPGRAFSEVLLRYAVKVGAQEALAQLVATAGGCRTRDALDQRCTCGGDAVEQAVIVSSKWRVHADRPGRGACGVACAWRMLYVARPQVALVMWDTIIHAAGTAPPPPGGRGVQGGYNDCQRNECARAVREVSS